MINCGNLGGGNTGLIVFCGFLRVSSVVRAVFDLELFLVLVFRVFFPDLSLKRFQFKHKAKCWEVLRLWYNIFKEFLDFLSIGSLAKNHLSLQNRIWKVSRIFKLKISLFHSFFRRKRSHLAEKILKIEVSTS